MADEKRIEFDIDGYDIITKALMDLLNSYPGLNKGEEIKFSVLNENAGKAMFPLSGSIIESKTKDILGYTTEICQYPFMVICRYGHLNESRRVTMKEWLDTLGRWLEQQTVTINEEQYTLDEYPSLTGERKFIEIRRTTPASLNDIGDNNTEDWAISILARYRNHF